MKKEDLFEALEGASDAYLESAAEAMMAKADTAQTVIRGGGKHRRWKQFLKQPRSWISAACILLSVSLLAVTLLLGSMYGFHLGPLETQEPGEIGNVQPTINDSWQGCPPEPSTGELGLPEYPHLPRPTAEEKQVLIAMAKEAFSDYSWWDETVTINDKLDYAMSHDYVVSMDQYLVAGKELWNSFFEKTQKGESATVKYVEYSEDHFVPIKYFLYFDGNCYRMVVLAKDEASYTIGGYYYLLRFDFEGEDEKGIYNDAVYYWCDYKEATLDREDIGKDQVLMFDKDMNNLYKFQFQIIVRSY